MPILKDFQAAILEESILYLIRVCGYKEVGIENIGIDNTLTSHHAGMGIAIKGRGSDHQIDCIGDYVYTPPLCNPIRLLGETKFYGFNANGSPKKVGLGEIRDAIGLLKDVSEYFSRGNNDGVIRRYSYQSVFFSATGFSKSAQDLAYAHDINLISAYGGPHLSTIINSIRRLEINDFRSLRNEISRLRDFRNRFRKSLREGTYLNEEENRNNRIRQLIENIRQLDKLFLGTLDNKLTIMLSPLFRNDEWIRLVHLAIEGSIIQVELYWDDQPNDSGDFVFRIVGRVNGRRSDLFFFLVPEVILKNFLREGQLNEEDALDMKREYFSNINIPFIFEGTFSLLRMRLDQEWLIRLQRQL